MPNRTKVIDIELSQSLPHIEDLDGYQKLQGLVLVRGVPLGYIWLPVEQGQCTAGQIAQAIMADYRDAIANELIRQNLGAGLPLPWTATSLLEPEESSPPGKHPSNQRPNITVVVCPRTVHSTLLLECLNALHRGTQLPAQIIVTVPCPEALRQSVEAAYPEVQWLAMAEPNRCQQRNLAIQQATGDVIAFISDCCRVSDRWLASIETAFKDYSEAAAVTGLVTLESLETETEAWAEQVYELDWEYQHASYRIDVSGSIAWTDLNTLPVGSGVNIAYRRSALTTAPFDPALDYTGYLWEGADLDVLKRVQLEGSTILYDPSVRIRYKAPEAVAELQTQAFQNMVGFYTYLFKLGRCYPVLQRQLLTLAAGKLARLGLRLIRPYLIPRQLTLAAIKGAARGLRAAALERLNPFRNGPDVGPAAISEKLVSPKLEKLMAVRTVELNQPLPWLTDIHEYQNVRVFVTIAGSPIGSVDIASGGQAVGPDQLQRAIAMGLSGEILAQAYGGDTGAAWSAMQAALNEYLLPEPDVAPASTAPFALAEDVPVSIIITTCDRPKDLENCLKGLIAQQTQRPIEIIVADNRPASGLTAKVVSQFPQVKLVEEPRPGGSYGRNAAITASTGDIVVTVDDDVTVSPGWLEKLIAPLARPEVMVVTGNVLPKELETPAQLMFENLKGGLGAGLKPFEADGHWLASYQTQSPPVWDLGVSANAAFRATIFSHPSIGLMDEVLGPGTPTIGGEENHLIYKVLKAGYVLVYCPGADVWHRHRREMSAFYRQIYGHMKGGTAYHLILWLKEGDRRAFRQLYFELPRYYSRRVYERFRGWHDTPWPVIWSEITGYVSGFWGYWQSCQRVKQQGRSAPYIPVSQRLPVASLAEAVDGNSRDCQGTEASLSTIGGRQ